MIAGNSGIRRSVREVSYVLTWYLNVEAEKSKQIDDAHSTQKQIASVSHLSHPDVFVIRLYSYRLCQVHIYMVL